MENISSQYQFCNKNIIYNGKDVPETTVVNQTVVNQAVVNQALVDLTNNISINSILSQNK